LVCTDRLRRPPVVRTAGQW